MLTTSEELVLRSVAQYGSGGISAEEVCAHLFECRAEVSRATVFRALRKLASSGWVACEQAPPSVGRPGGVYAISTAGALQVRDMDKLRARVGACRS